MKVLGIDFFEGSVEQSVKEAISGGLLVAPSGPGLANDLKNELGYRQAVTEADMALPDSGAMVLAWNIRQFCAGKNSSLKRLSGLTFFRALIEAPEMREKGNVLWVMPSVADAERNLEWLGSVGIFAGEEDVYLAPFYKKDAQGLIRDFALLDIIQKRRPQFVIINVGGGTQELLGWFLRQHLGRSVSVICTGAAIAFLSGTQANIPPWADRYYLGWLLRCLSNPGLYLRRYWAAKGLFLDVFRFRESP